MNRTDRNNRIVHMAASKMRPQQIARITGLSYANIRHVIKTNARCLTTRLPPAGMPIKVAVAIEQAIGCWPEPESVAKIAERRIDFMKFPGTGRAEWQEFDAWVERENGAKNR